MEEKVDIEDEGCGFFGHFDDDSVDMDDFVLEDLKNAHLKNFSGGYDSSDETDHNKIKVGDAYNDFLPTYKELTNAITTKEAYEHTKATLESLHKDILAMTQEKKKPAKGGMISLPETDKRHNDKRKRKGNSPKKTKRRRNT